MFVGFLTKSAMTLQFLFKTQHNFFFKNRLAVRTDGQTEWAT